MVVVWLGTCLGGLGVQASKVLPKIFGGAVSDQSAARMKGEEEAHTEPRRSSFSEITS